MDRGRYRALLSAAAAGGVTLLALTGVFAAQAPAPASPVASEPSAAPATATATPWVQASPPAASPAASKPPAPNAAPSLSKDEIAKAMERKRREELARQPFPAPAKPPNAVQQLSPEEREAYERNLTLWLALPPEERQALRGQATERIREETEKAYATSGLNLNDDQREVFALRYRQERRRLERDIQEKASAERARRLPEIMDRLKHEFPASVANPPKPTPPPIPTATATPSAVPK